MFVYQLYFLHGYFVFAIEFDELFEHKDLFGHVHYFSVSSLFSLIKKDCFSEMFGLVNSPRCLFKLRRGSIGNLLMVPQSLQDDCIWKKPQISVIIALFLFAIMKDFLSQRGCRKLVKKKHGWYLYFDSKPDIREIEEKHSSVWTTVQVDGRSSTQQLLTFPKTLPLAVNFLNWLRSTAGGGKTKQ